MSALSRYTAADAPTVGALWIQRRLGHTGSDRLLKEYLAGLIADYGFPPPLPHQKWGGGIATGICVRRSRWTCEAVIAWLDDFLPPDAALALDVAKMADAAADMDAAAERLTLVTSEGRRL